MWLQPRAFIPFSEWVLLHRINWTLTNVCRSIKSMWTRIEDKWAQCISRHGNARVSWNITLSYFSLFSDSHLFISCLCTKKQIFCFKNWNNVAGFMWTLHSYFFSLRERVGQENIHINTAVFCQSSVKKLLLFTIEVKMKYQ